MLHSTRSLTTSNQKREKYTAMRMFASEVPPPASGKYRLMRNSNKSDAREHVQPEDPWLERERGLVVQSTSGESRQIEEDGMQAPSVVGERGARDTEYDDGLQVENAVKPQQSRIMENGERGARNTKYDDCLQVATAVKPQQSRIMENGEGGARNTKYDDCLQVATAVKPQQSRRMENGEGGARDTKYDDGLQLATALKPQQSRIMENGEEGARDTMYYDGLQVANAVKPQQSRIMENGEEVGQVQLVLELQSETADNEPQGDVRSLEASGGDDLQQAEQQTDEQQVNGGNMKESNNNVDEIVRNQEPNEKDAEEDSLNSSAVKRQRKI